MRLPSILGIRGARDKPKDSYGGSAYSFFFGRSASGKNVNERAAMQTTAVYSCVRILAETVASLPVHLYRYTETGKERVYDHSLYRMLNDEPNPEITSFVFRETLSHLLIWGNAYAQIIRDGNGRGLALYPLLPDKMEADRDENGQLYYIYTRNSDENPNFEEYGRVYLRQQDVLHIPGLGFDGLVGYSPIAMAKNAVGMTLACEEYGASFFENGANPGGVLEHPGVLKDPAKVRESWHSVYGGSKNAGKVAVLEEGMKYQQIGIPPEEAQFLELDPWVIRWEQSLQRALLLPQEKNEYFLKLNVDGLLRGDYQSRMTGYSIGRQNGWLSTNDIREMENMNLVPVEEGGDLYLINGNMTKLKDAAGFLCVQ